MKKTVSGIFLTLLLISMLMLVFNIQSVESKSRAWTIDGWAVLLEMNEFPEGWSDMPVEFINSERMQTALFSLGWQSDHVHVIHDNLTISVVQEAVGWLVNSTDYGEIALLYIFTHGTWIRNVLLWNDWFPAEWEKLNTSKRVLMVDTCRAEACIEPIRNGSSPHISLAHCSAHEVGWAGVEEEGLPIIGSVWNYYFCNALLSSSADLNDDGYVSIEEAFNFSTPLVQRYMNETVFAVPEFLEMYHDIGIYPENYDAYPHPVMDDQYPEQLNLDLRPHWTTSFIGLGGYPIVDFAVYKGKLYAASDNNLHMYNGSWDVIDAPTYVLSLVPYEDKLYIGGKGGLYSYDGTTFTLIFTVSNYIKALGIYGNTVYAGTVLDNPPTLYYCSGSADNPANWHVDTDFSTILNFSGPFGSIDSFAVYDNKMYVSSGGTVYSYNGTHWSTAKTYDDVYAFLDMEVYDGKLYLATRDLGSRCPLYQGGSGFCGRVIEINGTDWTIIFDHDYWVYSLETCGDRLYAGTANEIWEYDGTNWSLSFSAIEDAYYGISSTNFNNPIYFGMGNGHIFSKECPIAAESKVLVLVHNEIFGQLQSRLERYASDITDFDLMIINGSWADPEDVRLQIQEAYSNYNISGCILVGDIVAAYYRSENVHGTFIFPTDLYYMDLDGAWIDYEPDGIYDNRTDPNGVEIWVSRIKAPTNNVTLLQSYFDKNHDFYTGVLGDYDKALAYVKDCEFGQAHRVEVLKNIYDETDIIFLCGANATKVDYLETLRQGFETVWISCHGGPTRQLIEEDPVVWFDGNDAKMIENGSIFYLLHNCEVGRYDVVDYLAGWYVFGNNNGLIALASTTVWESIDHDFFINANNNSYIGNAFMETIKYADELAKTDPIVARNLYYGAVLIGDPFIQIGQLGGGIRSMAASATDDLIKTVPEFPSLLVLPLFMIATLLAVIVYRRKLKETE